MTVSQTKSKQRVISHGEVFTNEREVKAMCDIVKQETERMDSRFLEPACGEGNFLAEVLSRKLAVVKAQYGGSSYDYERYSILVLASIYGVDILADNARICRERLFAIWNEEYTSACKSEANDDARNAAKYILNSNIVCGNALSMMCVDEEQQDTDKFIVFTEWTLPNDGICLCSHNIRFVDMLKTSSDACNAQISLFETAETSVTFTFDVIISNPPYAQATLGAGRQAKPLYNQFVEHAKQLNPRYISMIIPSRWFAGGMGLDEFRATMMNDRHLVRLVDYTNAKDCFPDLSISGGVCYFLWSRDVESDCEFTNIISGEHSTMVRPLNEFSTLVRYNRAISIVRKVNACSDAKLESLVSSLTPYGLSTSFRGHEIKQDGDLAVHTSDGITYAPRDVITKGFGTVDSYKVLISKTSAEHAGEPDKDGRFKVISSSMRILSPGEVCTHSYFVVGNWDSYQEAENALNYMKTKFVRFLMLMCVSGIGLSRLVFSLVPIQDFSVCWDDSSLYAKYQLDNDEVAFIDAMIKSMHAESF